MKKFEYKMYAPEAKQTFTTKKIDEEKTAHDLESFGLEGWELISTMPISGNTGVSYGAATAGFLFIFKRELV